jgi:hypothetical protein
MKNRSPSRRWVGFDFLDQVSRFRIRIGTCFPTARIFFTKKKERNQTNLF